MLYVKKHQRNTFFKFCFPIFPMGAIRYSCPILPAKEIRLLEKFQPDSFQTERLVCVETDGRTDRRTDGHGYIDSSSHADQEYILCGVGNVF